MESEQKDKKVTVKKIINIILDVLFVVFVGFAVVAVVMRINVQKNGALTMGGNEYRIVLTDSMSENNHIPEDQYQSYKIKTIKKDAMVTIKKKASKDTKFYDDLAVGDVLTFYYYFTSGEFAGKQINVTHRLIDKTPDSKGGYVLTLMGDKEKIGGMTQTIRTSQEETSPNYVVGKVTGVNYGAGATMKFLTSSAGIIVFVIVPCSALFIYEVVKIILIAKKLKQEKDEEVPHKQPSE